MTKMLSTSSLRVMLIGTVALWLACNRGEETKPKDSIAGSSTSKVTANRTASIGPAGSAGPTASTEQNSEPFQVPRVVEDFLAWVEKVHPIVEAGPKPQDSHPEVGLVTCLVSPNEKKYFGYGYCNATTPGVHRYFTWPHRKPNIWEVHLSLVLYVELDCAALGKKLLGIDHNQYWDDYHCAHTEDQQIIINNWKENKSTYIHVFKKDFPLERDPLGELTPRTALYKRLHRMRLP